MDTAERGKEPPLIRSNTANTAPSKRHTSPSLYLPFRHHHHQHYQAHEVAYPSSRTKPAMAPLEQELYKDSPRRERVSSSLHTSRKGSLQHDLAARGSSTLMRPKPRKSAVELDDISRAIISLQASSQQQMVRLEATYSSVLQKLHELSAISSRLYDLGELAKSTVHNFDAADTRCRNDFTAQIRGIERFMDEPGSIKTLKERLMAQKTKVKNYHERLDRVQEKIQKHKELEIIWRQRASRRLRLLWGFISVLVILWLLATASSEPEALLPNRQGDVGVTDIEIIVPMLSDGALREL